jgi:hypothetical protein
LLELKAHNGLLMSVFFCGMFMMAAAPAVTQREHSDKATQGEDMRAEMMATHDSNQESRVARYFYNSARPTAGAAQPEWKEVDIDGKVTFRVPTNLTTAAMDTTSPYKAFRREGMDIALFSPNIHTGSRRVRPSITLWR